MPAENFTEEDAIPCFQVSGTSIDVPAAWEDGDIPCRRRGVNVIVASNGESRFFRSRTSGPNGVTQLGKVVCFTIDGIKFVSDFVVT